MAILGHGSGQQEGGRKWAGRGGIRIFPAGGGARLLENCKKSPKNALFEGVLEIYSKYVHFCIFEAHFFMISSCSMGNIFL